MKTIALYLLTVRLAFVAAVAWQMTDSSVWSDRNFPRNGGSHEASWEKPRGSKYELSQHENTCKSFAPGGLIRTSKLAEWSQSTRQLGAVALKQGDTGALPPARTCGARASRESGVVRLAGGCTSVVARAATATDGWRNWLARRAYISLVPGSNPGPSTRSGRHEKSTTSGTGNGTGESCDVSKSQPPQLRTACALAPSMCGSDLLTAGETASGSGELAAETLGALRGGWLPPCSATCAEELPRSCVPSDDLDVDRVPQCACDFAGDVETSVGRRAACRLAIGGLNQSSGRETPRSAHTKNSKRAQQQESAARPASVALRVTGSLARRWPRLVGQPGSIGGIS